MVWNDNIVFDCIGMNSIVDFRFYTYLPVNKEYPSFSDDEGYYTGDFLWRSLLTQLKKHFEKKNLLYELNTYLSIIFI